MTNKDFAELWAMADNLKAAVVKMDDTAVMGRRGATAARLWEIVDLAEATEAKLRDWLNEHAPKEGE